MCTTAALRAERRRVFGPAIAPSVMRAAGSCAKRRGAATRKGKMAMDCTNAVSHIESAAKLLYSRR